MTSRSLDRRCIAVLIAAAGAFAPSCDDEGGPAPTGGRDGSVVPYDGGVAFDDGGVIVPTSDGPLSFDRPQLLATFAACARFTIGEFVSRAGALDAATMALATQPSAEVAAAARSAYRDAMLSWQVVEVMQFGPAATSMPAGGAGLRNQIYAWPVERRCDVETQIVNRGWEQPGFEQSLVTRRGLAALEYLLFHAGNDTACTDPATVAGWAALVPDELAARKRAYAARVAADVNARAQQLAAAWAPGGGNFAGTLATAGPGNPVFPSTQAALNAISDALFYVESEVKDMKVGPPLGAGACSMDSSCAPPESVHAGLSKENLRSNLTGFRRIFEGCGAGFAGLGFDDLLTAVGAQSTTAAILGAQHAALAALDAIEEPTLAAAIAADKPSVQTLYTALRTLATLLKTDFMMALDLDLPDSVDGDVD